MNQPSRQIRLLIVEDDEDDYILTRTLLDEAYAFDFSVDWASSTEQANDLLARNEHHLCLMDYRLGAEVGLDLVRKAENLGFTGPIIMLTGQDDHEVEIEAAAAGAADYLVKDGLSASQLIRSIRYALARLDVQAEREERTRAESQNRAKTEFLANLSHEIRTPLTAIVGYTELLLQEARADISTDPTPRLEVVNRNSRHLLSLLNDTLDLSRIEAGKMEVDMTPVDLAIFLADLQSLVKTSAAEKGLEFILELHEDLPLSITTDAVRLRQILLNLCTNAIKFTDSGHVTLGLHWSPDKEDSLEFSVRDTGVGIPPDKLDSIFSPFVQHSGEKAQLGTGLGLTISRHLASLLGGTLKADSVPGEGSVFTLSIAPGDISEANVGVPDLTGARSAPTDPSLAPLWQKALVVDDVEDIRQLVSALLHREGIECIPASDGRQALELLESSPAGSYDLLIMDINMPHIDGLTAIRRLRASGSAHSTIPAVALTAANLSGVKEGCLAAGFDAFVAKPLSTEALLAALHSLQDNPHAHTDPGSVTTLIVEDHADTREALCDMLDLLGITVIGAGNPEEAMTAIQEHPIEHVLCDVHLGGEDGVVLARKLREVRPQTRVILVTGDQRLYSSPPPEADGVVLKPVSLDDLQRCLKQTRL